MGRILEHRRIFVAGFLSLAIIVGAFVLARGVESPPIAQASAETALLQAIATKDSDNDGLPDWEEALYGTNPNASDSLNLGMTDGEAVAKGLVVPKAIADISVATSSPSYSPSDPSVPPPATEGSITDTFAKNFFTLYVATKQANGGNPLSQAQISTLAGQVMNQVTASISPALDFKSKADIKVSGTGPDAMRTYAAEVENVFKTQGVHLPKNGLQYLKDAVQNDDTSALDNINKIATAYRTTAVGLSVLTVPEELSDIHLALINASARLGEENADFARLKTDPIAAMLALQQYPKSANALVNIFKDVARIYAAKNATPAEGAPGASFVNVMSKVISEIKSSHTQP